MPPPCGSATRAGAPTGTWRSRTRMRASGGWRGICGRVLLVPPFRWVAGGRLSARRAQPAPPVAPPRASRAARRAPRGSRRCGRSRRRRCRAAPRASRARAARRPAISWSGFSQMTECASRESRAICAASTSGSPTSSPSEQMTTTAPRARPPWPYSSRKRLSESPMRVPPSQSHDLGGRARERLVRDPSPRARG